MSSRVAPSHAEDHDFSDWTDCWNCAGDGSYADCFEEYACIDPEGGCDLCTRRCSVCRGKGGWPTVDEPEEELDHATPKNPLNPTTEEG